jgi:hypothetical protein
MTVQPGTAPQRVQRECDACHLVDDLPHHQVVVPGPDGLVVESRHFACCQRTGCPDGSCNQILNGSPGV